MLNTDSRTQSLFSIAEKREPVILRDYQEEALAKLIEGWSDENFRRQLLVLATGLGKTICFAHAIEWALSNGKKSLVLAHREELLEQAEEKIRRVIGNHHFIGREQGQNYASLEDSIVTASVPTLGRSVSDGDDSAANQRIVRFPKDHFGLIIFDEAHHCTASTYLNIIDRFCGEGSTTCMLGVTATPKRSDRESLHNIFDRVAYRMDIVEGIKKGHLAPVASHRISSTTDLRNVRTTAGDYNIKDLSKAVNNKERNSLIVRTYLELFGNREELFQAIVFATNVEHATDIAQEFKQSGISCEVISGETPKDFRRQSISDFKSEKITILTNYGVLTEGFDHENLRVIINARPTKSELLLTQIVGRGTRLSSNKKRCEVIEIVDLHSDETATCSKIFGFRQTFDCEGHDFLECISEAERMAEEKSWFNPYWSHSWSDMFERFEKSAKAPAPTFSRGQTRSRYRYYPAGDGVIRNQITVDGEKYMLRICQNALGTFDAELKAKDDDGWMVIHSASHPNRMAATELLEAYVEIEFPTIDRLLNLNAPWRARVANEPVTDKQWNLIQKFRLTQLERHLVSKGDAIEILNEFFNRGRNTNA